MDDETALSILFDPGEREDVLRLLHEPLADSHLAGLADGIERNLSTALECYGRRFEGVPPGRNDFAPWEALCAACDDLIAAARAVDRESLDSCAARLKVAWLEFAAVAAAYRMYHDLPLDVKRIEKDAEIAKKRGDRLAAENRERVKYDEREKATWRGEAARLRAANGSLSEEAIAQAIKRVLKSSASTKTIKRAILEK